MKDDFYSAQKESDNLDFGKIFRFLLMQSKLIISIVLVVFVLTYIQYSFATKRYLIESLLQYESFNQNILDPSQSLGIPATRSSDISNLTQLYESRTNFLKVIKDLRLNIDIKNLESDEAIDIEIMTDNTDQSDLVRKLKFSFSKNDYSLLDDSLNEIQKSRYGESMIFDDLKITIASSTLKKYRPIDIHFRYPEDMYSPLKSKINVYANSSRNSFFTNEGLFTISYVTDDIEEGKKIINYANEIFLNQRIYVETEKSRKAIEFIDKNLSSIEEVVEFNKIKFKEFREENKSVDVSLEIESIVNKIQSLDESLTSIDIEINKAQEIYTQNNPFYLNLLKKKSLIERQKAEVLSEIELMPKEQQEYIDLYNNVELSQSLFKELESRRLGFSILEASTIGDIRIVDEAYVVSLVSPKAAFVLLSTLLALVFACLIAVIRGFNFLPISNPAELFDNNIHLPIIGVIPKIEDMSLAENDNRLTSSIESLIVNTTSLDSEKKDTKIITISSPSPFNGKSTISMKLSEGLAKLNKKVLLIDADLKRGKLARNYNIKSISQNTFNSIDESLLNKYLVNDNFYLIPRVKGLNNTFQFLYNHQYKEKIKLFRDYFDYIVFDTGPILSVSDTSILVEQSDLNILVVRHGINRMNEIKQSIDNYKQINQNVDGIIYNAYAKPNSYYGYYGIYGNYSYQYYAEKYLEDTYEYEKKD